MTIIYFAACVAGWVGGAALFVALRTDLTRLPRFAAVLVALTMVGLIAWLAAASG